MVTMRTCSLLSVCSVFLLISIRCFSTPPPTISNYNIGSCAPGLGDERHTIRSRVILDERNKSITVQKKEYLSINYLSVSKFGVIHLRASSGVSMDYLYFDSGASLLFDNTEGFLSYIAVKKEYGENDSIINKLGYAYGGKDYILKRSYLCNGYWYLAPDFAAHWTPEPSTYGAIVSVCLLGLAFWRKRKSRLKQGLKKPLGCGDAQAA